MPCLNHNLIIQIQFMYRILFSLLLCTCILFADAQDSSQVLNEVIYGRKDGMALTLIVNQPTQNPKGKAVINLVSGNWVSGYGKVPGYLRRAKTFTNRGYTVFTVITSSQPRYNIVDEVDDVKRSVRFVRYHAADYNIDPGEIGIVGSSSGGQLALMAATASDSAIRSFDPVDKVSSRVQAAGVFFPPTDFLNYGHMGYNSQASEMFITYARLGGAFDFRKIDPATGIYTSITDTATRKILAGEISPVYQVSSDDPPIIIFHGDKDKLIPIQQSERMINALTKAGVKNRLIIKQSGGHGWPHMETEENQIADWFDQYLK